MRQLWRLIFKYLDIYDYNSVKNTNQQFRLFMYSSYHKKKVSDFIDKIKTDLAIKSIENDDRDDCGTFCVIYYLINGEIMTSEEYLDLIQYYQEIFMEYFNYRWNFNYTKMLT